MGNNNTQIARITNNSAFKLAGDPNNPAFYENLGDFDDPAFGSASENLGNPHDPAFYNNNNKLYLEDKGIIKKYDKCPDFLRYSKRKIVRNSFENPIPKQKYLYKKFYKFNPTRSDILHYYNLYHINVHVFSNEFTHDGITKLNKTYNYMEFPISH